MTSDERLSCSFTLNFREGTSNKFYFAELNGDVVSIRYGRTYSNGTEMVKSWGTPEAAAKEFFRLARDKMRKGYRIEVAKVADHAEARKFTTVRPAQYGAVERERAEITLELGARMVDNLTRIEPDEDLMFDSLFADGDAELIAALARSHPAVNDSDITAVGAWLSEGKAAMAGILD